MRQNYILYGIAFLFLLSFFACQSPDNEKSKMKVGFEVTEISGYGKNDGAAKAVVENGTAPYTFYWSTYNDSSSTISNLQPGEYFVTVIDAQNNTITDTVVFEQPKPKTTCYDQDGNVYDTLVIGGKVWMAENLKTTKSPDGSEIKSFAYNNNEENAEKYGRLYDWNTAMNGSKSEKAQGICPKGWHIPSDAEWTALEEALGNDFDKFINPSGFAVKFGGVERNEAFYGIEIFTHFWSSTSRGENNAWKRHLHIVDEDIFRYHGNKKSGYSIRCIKD